MDIHVPCKNVVPRRRKPLNEECDLNQAHPDKGVHPDGLTSQPCVGGMHADVRNSCSTDLFDNLKSKSALVVVKNLEGRRERKQPTVRHKNKHVGCTRSEMAIEIQYVKESKTFKSTIRYSKERAATSLSLRTEKKKTEYGVNVCTDLGLESIVLPSSGSYDKASHHTNSFGHGSRERHSSSSSDDRIVSEECLVSDFHNLQVNNTCNVPVDNTPSVPYTTSQLEQGDIGFSGLRFHCQANGSEGPTPFDGYCPNTGDLHSQDTHILRKIRNFHKDSPKHWDLASRWLRRSSFRISTLESGVVNSLVEAGFFCTGVPGRVNCFCCGVCIEQWNTSDEPLFVHIRIAPSCVYPRVYLGEEIYTLYKSNLETQTENNGQRSTLVEEADVGGALGGTVDGYAPRSVKRSLENTRTGYVFSDTEMAAVNIRTPDFACYNVRISTFSQWPPGLTQTPASLATAGFYYTGMNDTVRCYACDVGLHRWNEGDDPWTEHVKWHLECPHVLRVRGSDFIELVKTTIVSNVESNLETQTEDNVQTASPVEEEDVGGALGGTVDGYAPRSVKRSLENTCTGYVFSDTELAAVNIKTPDCACYNVRISTFSQWPPGLTQTPASLAIAGFYYTGMNDTVCCYACDVGLQRWDEGDDPWTEHAKGYPECPHVLRVRGSDFIELVQTTLASNVEFDLEVEDVQTSQSLEPGSGNSCVDVSISNGRLSFEATEINRGYSKSDIFKVLEICIASRRPKTVTSLISIIESFKINDKNRVQPENNASKLLAKMDHRLHIVYCMKCKENQSNMLFLPCAHHCTCVDCARGAMICPLCTSEIQERIKTFMA